MLTFRGFVLFIIIWTLIGYYGFSVPFDHALAIAIATAIIVS